MANTSAQPEQVYVGRFGESVAAVVRWSGGSTLLKTGQRFAATDQLVRERPGLFTTSDPTGAPRSTTPGKPQRRCWVCRYEFTPSQGHARYCSKACRRRRERSLAQTVKWVAKGAKADPRRPADSCTLAEAHAYAAEIQARLARVSQLGGYLHGRGDPADPFGPPSPDRDIRVPGDRAELVARTRAEVERLAKVRDAAGEWLHRVEALRAEEKALRSTVETYGPGNEVERMHRQRVAELEREVSAWSQALESERV